MSTPEVYSQQPPASPEVSDPTAGIADPLEFATQALYQRVAPGNQRWLEQFSTRERQVLSLLGKPYSDIASDIGIQESTARSHAHSAMRKIGVKRNEDMLVACIRYGMVGLDGVPAGKTEVLSPRERQLLGQHYRDSYVEASVGLGLSVTTIRTHWCSVFEKLGALSRTGAIMLGVKDGLIQLDPVPVSAEGVA